MNRERNLVTPIIIGASNNVTFHVVVVMMTVLSALQMGRTIVLIQLSCRKAVSTHCLRIACTLLLVEVHTCYVPTNSFTTISFRVIEFYCISRIF
jgi:hypothetical protein